MMNNLKIVSVLVLLHLSIIGQAQLYAPEIKVQETTNQQIEIGSDVVSSDMKVHGEVEADQMNVIGGIDAAYLKASGLASSTYGGPLAGDSNPFMIAIGKNLGHKDLTLFGSSSGSTLHLRLFDGSLKMGYNSTPNAEIKNNGNANFKRVDATSIYVNGSMLANNLSIASDRRLKEDIQDYQQGLAFVKKINPKKYKYKPISKVKTESDSLSTEEDKSSSSLEQADREHIGVVAQELQKIAPDLVGSFTDGDGEETLTINHTALTFILINAVKELSQQVELLEESLAAVKKEK